MRGAWTGRKGLINGRHWHTYNTANGRQPSRDISYIGAAGGDEAVEIATDFLFDMAFIDIGMPYLNGYETVAAMVGDL